MKPAWDRLMDEFKDSKTALVADVDCTVEEELCREQGVEVPPPSRLLVPSRTPHPAPPLPVPRSRVMFFSP